MGYGGRILKLLVLSGGRHPYEESTPLLEHFLVRAGHEVLVTEDASVLCDKEKMVNFDSLVFNTRRENLPDFAELAFSKAEQESITEYISNGGGFVCLHISTCVTDSWPEYHDITGGGWITGTSFHPPYGNFSVNVSNPSHEAVLGIEDFHTDDELYMGLAIKEGNDVFITGTAGEGTYPWGPDRSPTFMPAGTFPLGWTRSFGKGTVFVLLLGHDGKSFESPQFQQMVLNGLNIVNS